MDSNKIKEELLALIPDGTPVDDEALDEIVGGLASGSLAMSESHLNSRLAQLGLADKSPMRDKALAILRSNSAAAVASKPAFKKHDKLV